MGEAYLLLPNKMKDNGSISSRVGVEIVWDIIVNSSSAPSVPLVHS